MTETDAQDTETYPYRCRSCNRLLTTQPETCGYCGFTTPETTAGWWLLLLCGVGACFSIIFALPGIAAAGHANRKIKAARAGHIATDNDGPISQAAGWGHGHNPNIAPDKQ